MTNDTERWKTERADELTRAGWTHEEAMQTAQIEATRLQNELDRQLQWMVESGKLSLEEAKLAEQTREFDSKEDFDRWALEQGWEQDAIERAWQTGENVAQRAWQSGEASLDRQLTREVEAGRLDIEERKLAEQTREFDTKLDFDRWALEQGWEQDAIDRAWQSGENALDRAHDLQMQTLQQEFEMRGIKWAFVASQMDGMDHEQANTFLNQTAIEAGITWTYTDPVTGETEEIPGIMPLTEEQQDETAYTEHIDNFIATPNSTLNVTDAGTLSTNIAAGDVPEGMRVVDYTSIPETIADWTTGGNRRWALTNEAKAWGDTNTGAIVRMPNGALYQVMGSVRHEQEYSAGYLVFRDVVTGQLLFVTSSTARQGARNMPPLTSSLPDPEDPYSGDYTTAPSLGGGTTPPEDLPTTRPGTA